MYPISMLLNALLFILAMQQSAHAAHTTFEYFILETCTHESITDLIEDPVDSDANSKLRQQAGKRGILAIDSIPRCYGFCDYLSGKSISCSLDSCTKFPLRNATFQRIRDKSPLSSYRCVKGCGKDVPALLHEMGYEPTEEEYNVLWTERYLKFNKKCRNGR